MSLGIAVGLIWLSPFRTTRAVWIPVSGDKSRMCRVGHPSCCANAISPQQQRLPRSIMRSCRSRMTLFGMEKRISKLAFRMLPCLHYRIRRRCTTSRKSPIRLRHYSTCSKESTLRYGLPRMSAPTSKRCYRSSRLPKNEATIQQAWDIGCLRQNDLASKRSFNLGNDCHNSADV